MTILIQIWMKDLFIALKLVLFGWMKLRLPMLNLKNLLMLQVILQLLKKVLIGRSLKKIYPQIHQNQMRVFLFLHPWFLRKQILITFQIILSGGNGNQELIGKILVGPEQILKEKKITLWYKLVGLMQMLMLSGRVEDFQQKLNGNMPREEV